MLYVNMLKRQYLGWVLWVLWVFWVLDTYLLPVVRVTYDI
jgi:hypothetical protein